ncbi:hypothetical protein [Roseibium sediminis]|uniref:hypothetical protein n=1 Tax=Roseibium sediminis TaxID=1775174 RepID=UPI00123CB8AA|nr:hypothetical protein [Roseibium sediminis]
MAVSIKSTQTFEWAGGYPLNFSQGAVAAAGNFALVYFTTGPSYDPAAVLPVVTWGSKTATLVHGFTNTGAAGTIWVYRIANPTTGTLSVSLANTYIGPGMVSVLCLDGVDTANPIGGSDTDGVAATGGSVSISLTTQEPNGLIIQFAMGIYDGTPSLTWGSPTASLVFSSDNPANRILRVYKQEPSSAGQVISATWDNTYNQNVISALEVRPWTLVEDKGDTLLVLIGGSYHVVPSGGQPIKITRYNAGIGPTSYAGWAVIQAENIPGGSGYKLLWFNASSGAYNEWTVTSAGGYSSQAAPTDIKVQEVFYGVDLNGDGQIGVPQFLIEDNGDAELWLIGDDYHVTDANGTKIKLKRYGSGFGPNFVPGWTVTQAEPKPGGGYYIFWAKNDLTDFGVWTHDAAGVFLSTQVVTNVAPWEDIFKADLNGDGQGGLANSQGISVSAITTTPQMGVLAVHLPIEVASGGHAVSITAGVPTVGAGGISVSPSGLSAGIAAGVPTVGTGGISVSPSGLSAGIAAGVPTVGTGGISVSPSGLSTGIAAGVPAVGAGGISVSPSGLSASITAGVPTVGTGGISVSPSGLSAGIAAGVPTVGTGGISVSPSGLSTGIAAGVPAVGAGGISVSPSGLSASITAGVPAVGVGAVSASPSGLSAGITAGVPTVGTGGISVSPSGLSVNFATGQLTLEVGGTGIVSNGLASTIICGEPNVSIYVSVQGGFYAIETGSVKISLNVSQLGEPSKILLGQADISVGGVAIRPGSIASPILLGSTYVGRVISVLGLHLSPTVGVPVVAPGAVTLQPGQLVVPSDFGGIVVRGGEYSGPLFTFKDGEWQPYEMKVFKNGAWVHARIKRRVGDEWVDV